MGKAFILTLVFCCGFSLALSAQNTDSLILPNETVYYSIESALKNPDLVYNLKLSKKKITSFPKEILLLKNLKYLDLSKNKIQEIPPEIAMLNHLEVLDLSKNKIVKFVKEICLLKNLKTLRLNRNELDGIPPEIENLKGLETLDLWDNNLVDFPDNLSKLEQLKVFDLRGVLIDKKSQIHIEELLPNTKIYFSPSCNCGF